MAKQTAAAQKRAEAEARKKAKLEASSAASKDNAKEVESASGMTLPQAGPSTAVQPADGPKADSQGAGISQEEDVATAGRKKPQDKSTAVAASSGLHDENQASNGAIPDGRGQTVAGAQCEGGQGSNGKPRAGKKRAADVHEDGEGTRAGQSRSTRSKIGQA
ncbi:hypothetical protein ABBQ38_000888 [Trebouxia sp. C0009 RCD-2024]